MEKNRLKQYTGKKQPKSGELDPSSGAKLEPYIPSPETIEAVNLALFLNRPLILEGEPGAGKTKLARAVAYELGLDYQYYCAKSSSKASDLLYSFDIVGRLRDAQLAANPNINHKDIEFIKNPENYLKLGKLGEAFQQTEKPTVVLIDEIDKADIDFPNDLLEALDNGSFEIPEIPDPTESDPKKSKIIGPNNPDSKPIVFITSNATKKLSDAFLRRCLYFYLEFPTGEDLKKIINARYQGQKKKLPPKLINTALKIFLDLRERMDEDDDIMVTKKVSTSEWLQWIEKITANPEEFKTELAAGKLPYAPILLKSKEHKKYKEGWKEYSE